MKRLKNSVLNFIFLVIILCQQGFAVSDYRNNTLVAVNHTHEGNLIINSQADLDNLSPGYTKVDGDLVISSSSGKVTDLSSLSTIREITGNLIIHSNSDLLNLNGLNGLTSVSNVYIGTDPDGNHLGNLALTDFCAIRNSLEAAIQVKIQDNAYNPQRFQIIMDCPGQVSVPNASLTWTMDKTDYSNNIWKPVGPNQTYVPGIEAVQSNSFLFVDGRTGTSFGAIELRGHSMDISGTTNNHEQKFFGLAKNVQEAIEIDEFTVSFWLQFEDVRAEERTLFGANLNGHGQDQFGLTLKNESLIFKMYHEDANGSVGTAWDYECFAPGALDAGFGWYKITAVFSKKQKYTRLMIGKPNGGAKYGPGTSEDVPGTNTVIREFDGRVIWVPGITDKLFQFSSWHIGPAPGLTFDDFKVYTSALSLEQAEESFHTEKNPTVQTFAFVANHMVQPTPDSPDYPSTALAVAELVTSDINPEFVITAGDESVAETVGSPHATPSAGGDKNLSHTYDSYLSMLPSTNAFFPTPGEGDYTPRSSGDLGIDRWKSSFRVQDNYNASSTYYSFKKGNVEFFMIDSNVKTSTSTKPPGIPALTDYDAEKNKVVFSDNTQYNWLKSAMTASSADFQVVVMHHPPYASYSDTDGRYADGVSYEAHQKRLRWPFKDWGADLVLSGNQSFYERNVSDELTYVVAGTGGHSDLKNAETGHAINITGNNLIRDDQSWGALKIDQYQDYLEVFYRTIDGHTLDHFIVMPNEPTVLPPLNQEELLTLTSPNEPFEHMRLYPNQTTGPFAIEFFLKEPGAFSYTLLGMDGKVSVEKATRQLKAGKNALYIEAGEYLPNGLYLFKASSNSQSFQKKVIINR